MWAQYIFVAMSITSVWCQRRRPNIMLLITDDQDVMLGSMDVMNFARNLISEQGVEFTNAFTTTPICCPSRSSILTGLYSHNHHVFTNNLNCSSLLWQKFYESKSYATYLRQSGYHTGYFGKYLNEYNGSYTPPGWDYWMGLEKNSKYYNYTLFHNGVHEKHGANYAQDYLTDLVTNRSIAFFRNAKEEDSERPVLSVVSYPAPHGPEDGAPQYQHLYQNPSSHKTASFAYLPNPDKHWIVQRNNQPLDDNQLHFSQLLQQKRLQTLRSVDDSIKKIVDMLQDIEELENTYILYFSDHGYHIGQFGLAKGKSQPYDFDIRIPFLMRGPNIPRNRTSQNIALNIDIAPTILGIANVPIPPEMDGRNLLDLFNTDRLTDRPWRDSFLIERGKMPRNKTQLVKPRMKTKVEKLATVCESPNYVNPCQPGQYWTCVIGPDNKRRLQKCKKTLPKQKTRQSHGQRRRKLCPCQQDRNWGTPGAHSDEINVLQTCNSRFPQSASRNPRSRRNRLSKRNLFNQHAKEYIDRTYRGYNKLRKEKTFNKRRFRRDISDSTTGGSVRSQNTGSMILTSSCRLYMPHFEIRCMEDLYNDPKVWVKHMGHLARMVKTLQLKMKYMKTLRKCLNSYDEMMKSTTRMCECPPPPPRMKAKSDNSENFSHPLFDVSTQEDRKYTEEKREFEKRKETVKLLQDIRKAKQAKNLLREQRGKTRVKRCGTQGLTCFVLSNRTWAVEPMWERNNECYCTNSNNNTYWCVRIINEHTNALYCQFITGFKEYYNMKEDPNQLVSTEPYLLEEEKTMYQDMISKLRRCRGDRNCTLPPFSNPHATQKTAMIPDVKGNANSSNLAPSGRSTENIDIDTDPLNVSRNPAQPGRGKVGRNKARWHPKGSGRGENRFNMVRWKDQKRNKLRKRYRSRKHRLDHTKKKKKGSQVVVRTRGHVMDGEGWAGHAMARRKKTRDQRKRGRTRSSKWTIV